MNNNEIKRANRKALPVFLLLLAVSVVCGGLFGYWSAAYGLNRLSEGMALAASHFGMYAAPWLMTAEAVLVLLVCIPVYTRARKLLDTWDGENEAVQEEAESKLSVIMWISSVALPAACFLIAASYSEGAKMMESDFGLFVLSLVSFIVIMIEAVVLQQKCVDVIKQMNPEKKGSVYDVKFQQKWLDSCDEAERLVIGNCAFKAYRATNTVCYVLAIVLAVSALVFGTGFLPSLAVCLIAIVNQSVYCQEALRISKPGNKIS